MTQGGMFENCDDCEKELTKCRETVSRAKEEKLNSCEKEKKQEVEKNKKLQKQLMRWTIGAAVASAVLGKEVVDKITEAFSSAEKAVQTINPNSFIDTLNSTQSDSDSDKGNDNKNGDNKEEPKEDKEEEKEKSDEVSFFPTGPSSSKTRYAYGGGWGPADFFDFGIEYNSNNFLDIQDIISSEMITNKSIDDALTLNSLDIIPNQMEYFEFDLQYSSPYLQSPPPPNVPSPATLTVLLAFTPLTRERRRRL